MSAFGGPRGVGSRPPEKGIFPLDHFGECKKLVDEYLQCLKKHRSDAEACRELSKAYLACRMERNLMARQDFEELGFKEGEEAAMAASSSSSSSTKAKQ